MSSKEQIDQYAAELIQRFEDFTRWALENWPNHEFPLMQSDFAAARKEIAHIAGSKLGEGNDSGSPAPSPTSNEQRQYIDMNPTPWP